jgi:predicted DNA-binding transcriptional regulator YafY
VNKTRILRGFSRLQEERATGWAIAAAPKPNNFRKSRRVVRQNIMQRPKAYDLLYQSHKGPSTKREMRPLPIVDILLQCFIIVYIGKAK